MFIMVASVVHRIFGGHDTFFDIINFVSAQLVSAQKLSALFPLCQFCSIANLKFKCFARHVCLN